MNALYVIACLLLGVSIAAEIVAKQWHAEAMQTVAKAATASPEVRGEARQNADVFVRAGDRASMSGLIGLVLESCSGSYRESKATGGRRCCPPYSWWPGSCLGFRWCRSTRETELRGAREAAACERMEVVVQGPPLRDPRRSM